MCKMKRGNHGFAEELLFREQIKRGIAVKDQREIHSVEIIKGGIAPRRSPLYILPWAQGDPRDPQNEVYLRYIVIKNAIAF